MRSQEHFLGIQARAVVLSLNVATFYMAYVAATRFALPTGGLETAWFISALALWFLTLLSAPWFLPPRDALTNSVTAASILVTMDLLAVPALQPELGVLRWASVGYCVLVAALSLAALFLHDLEQRNPSAGFAYRLTTILGRGEIVYSAPAMISIVGAYQAAHATMVWLVLLWVFFVVAQPVERLVIALQVMRQDRSSGVLAPGVGSIERIDYPNILRVRLNTGSAWKPRTLHVAALSDGEQQYVISLFSQVQGTDVIGTGLCIAGVGAKLDLMPGQVCASHDEEKAASFLERLSGKRGAELVGFTVENSTIGVLRFEVASSSDLVEGGVVFAKVTGREVFYQILDAETAEESFDQNPRGTHIVRAAQLGEYSAEFGFTKYPWLPAMNTPLFVARELTFEAPVLTGGEFEIGKVPSTDIGVVANVDELVEYHTAVLGVTGTGKTELALDVVRQAIACGTKVFCVDFTGDYRQRLNDLDPIFPSPTPKQAAELEEKLFAVDTGKYGAGDEKKVLREAIDELREQTAEQVDSFLRDVTDNLAIFELAELANTKATLRLTELYLSSIMQWARTHRKARRVLLVLEEAHTIIPETHGAGFDFDTQWVVSRIGQIALQGRKYGVGLLVITQRTALVSKTILSQCNTFLTHSLIDQTSLNFLESVYSAQHARTIPNLGQFEFLAYGKALRAERPVLLRRPFDPEKKKASEALRAHLEEPRTFGATDPDR